MKVLNGMDPSSRLDLDGDESFDLWCLVLRALPTELVAAVDKVGDRLSDVRRELGV